MKFQVLFTITLGQALVPYQESIGIYGGRGPAKATRLGGIEWDQDLDDKLVIKNIDVLDITILVKNIGRPKESHELLRCSIVRQV